MANSWAEGLTDSKSDSAKLFGRVSIAFDRLLGVGKLVLQSCSSDLQICKIWVLEHMLAQTPLFFIKPCSKVVYRWL